MGRWLTKMAAVRNILSNLTRFRVPLTISPYRFISTSVNFPLLFRTSLPMLAEPLKKKKKMDPAIVKAREEKKKRKIEKSIRRLEKNAKELKPIEELGIPLVLAKEQNLRTRKEKLSEEEQESNTLLLKSWSRYKYNQQLNENRMIDRITNSQQKALDQLKCISPELYLEAVQVDLQLVPFSASGPTRTPSLESYEPPDGEFVDTTPKWE